jgi:predicted DNA-binding transcriptional regulator AlpA
MGSALMERSRRIKGTLPMSDEIPSDPLNSRGRPKHPRPSRLSCEDPLLTAHESAAEAGCSIAAWWRGVRAEYFPLPYYVAPTLPRWRRSEIRAAIAKLRRRPAEAVAQRRADKLARDEASKAVRRPAPCPVVSRQRDG